MPTRKIRRKIRRKRRSIRGGTNLFPKASRAASRAAAERFAAEAASRAASAVGAMGAMGASAGKAVGDAAAFVQRHSGAKATAEGENSYKLNNCDELEEGRMVKYNDDFYYVSKIEKDETTKIIKHIEIKQGENESIKIEIENIKKIEPYNYGDILDNIKILTDIILNNKYLICTIDNKQKEYINIIININFIMKEINKLEVKNISGGKNNKRSRFSAPIGAKAKSNTTVKALPRHSGVKNNRRSRRHAWRAKGGGNVYCINDPYILGRLVQHNNEFYYVSKIVKDEKTKIIKHIEIKQGENDPIKIEIENIKNEIEPYNYDKVINSLLLLFQIILEKKYLYRNHENLENHKYNIAKMEIIKIINENLENINNNNTNLVDSDPATGPVPQTPPQTPVPGSEVEEE